MSYCSSIYVAILCGLFNLTGTLRSRILLKVQLSGFCIRDLSLKKSKFEVFSNHSKTLWLLTVRTLRKCYDVYHSGLMLKLFFTFDIFQKLLYILFCVFSLLNCLNLISLLNRILLVHGDESIAPVFVLEFLVAMHYIQQN